MIWGIVITALALYGLLIVLAEARVEEGTSGDRAETGERTGDSGKQGKREA